MKLFRLFSQFAFLILLTNCNTTPDPTPDVPPNNNPIAPKNAVTIEVNMSDLNTLGVDIANIEIRDNQGRVMGVDNMGIATVEKNSTIYAVDKNKNKILFIGYAKANVNSVGRTNQTAPISTLGYVSTAIFLTFVPLNSLYIEFMGNSIDLLNSDDINIADIVPANTLSEIKKIVTDGITEYGSVEDFITFGAETALSPIISVLTGGFFEDCAGIGIDYAFGNPPPLTINERINLSHQSFGLQNDKAPYFINNDNPNFKLTLNDAVFDVEKQKWILDVSVFSLSKGYYGIHTLSKLEALKPNATFQSSVTNGEVNFEYFTKPYNTTSFFNRITSCDGARNLYNETKAIFASTSSFSEFASQLNNITIEVDADNNIIYFVSPQDHKEVMVMNALSYLGDGMALSIESIFSAIKATEDFEEYKQILGIIKTITTEIIKDDRIAQLFATGNVNFKNLAGVTGDVLVELFQDQVFVDALKDKFTEANIQSIAGNILSNAFTILANSTNPVKLWKIGFKVLSFGLTGWELNTFVKKATSRYVQVYIPGSEAFVYDGNVNLATQAEVDNFGKQGFISINGSLKIGVHTMPNNSITNLNALSNLTSVGGDLGIYDNDLLTNLDGLSNLSSVGEDLQISSNALLTNLDGLSNISSVGGDLEIYINAALTNLDGLSNISSVGGDLWIWGNVALLFSLPTSLTNLDGLSNLSSVGGDLWIWGNDLLTNLDGLSNISSVGGGLYIYDNDLLTNLDGLSNISSVGEDLQIWGNALLPNLDGLSNISSVGGRLYISDNDLLTNLDGLSNISSVGEDLNISDNDLLPNLDGLSNISSVGGDLRIYDNDLLTDLCGIRPLLIGGNYTGSYSVYYNSYNPTKQDIIDGNCRE